MTPRSSHSRRRRERKDRLIQTRVAEDLEQALKREAARRRLTVSHLIRNTLEDAFHLVEGVTMDVEQLVTDSVELAAAVGRDARRFASMVRGEKEVGEPGAPSRDTQGATESKGAPGAQNPPDAPAVRLRSEDRAGPMAEPSAALRAVYGWNRILANREARCEACGDLIRRGDDAMIGLSDEPGPRVWLCAPCGDAL
jgi:hypothetical protein